MKELYWYLDATPTCSYARALYKYPQRAFPYAELRERAAKASATARRAGRSSARGSSTMTPISDVRGGIRQGLARGRVHPRDGDEPGKRGAPASRVLPQIWFRNVWSWLSDEERPPKPSVRMIPHGHGAKAIELAQEHLAVRWLYVEGAPELLFTENETNAKALFGGENDSPFTKDAFHRYVVQGEKDAVNPAAIGTKACARFRMDARARCEPCPQA